MIITIDGPAGAGKSSVARRLAQRLDFQFLDTGAMYRALTWAVLDRNVDVHDRKKVMEIADSSDFQFRQDRVWVDGQDVTAALRDRRVTLHISEIADNPEVRERMVLWQRQIVMQGDYVCEGRDQGTVAFPDADCKIFLTASPTERAKRRLQQLHSTGAETDLETILNDQQSRDQRDLDRPVGQLRRAEDAIELISDGKSLDQVVDEIELIARKKMQQCRRVPPQ